MLNLGDDAIENIIGTTYRFTIKSYYAQDIPKKSG